MSWGRKQQGKYFFHQCKFQKFFHICKQSTHAQEVHFWFVAAPMGLKKWVLCSCCTLTIPYSVNGVTDTH